MGGQKLGSIKGDRGRRLPSPSEQLGSSWEAFGKHSGSIMGDQRPKAETAHNVGYVK